MPCIEPKSAAGTGWRQPESVFFAKDFIATAEGLVFAVVESGTEQHKVLCFLRYIMSSAGWKKVATQEANALLNDRFPHYLYYSPARDAHLHAVSPGDIVKHYQPKERLQALLAGDKQDSVIGDLIKLCHLFEENGIKLQALGVTGSLLIGAQNPASDIDLVFYQRKQFQQARRIIRRLMTTDDLQPLREQDWQNSYQRRQCALRLAEYVWHERRKFNKALINKRKFDISLVSKTILPVVSFKKLKSIKLQAWVIDDELGFDYPAQFSIQHRHADTVVSYTATYTGQACKGERIEVAGLLEQSGSGRNRVVVGSSREAEGEYIKVIS